MADETSVKGSNRAIYCLHGLRSPAWLARPGTDAGGEWAGWYAWAGERGDESRGLYLTVAQLEALLLLRSMRNLWKPAE